MTEIEKKYFEELTKQRAKVADVLDSACLRGVKKSIVDKYSDQAHFVYELIQNADDALATVATFDVDDDKIVFIHNGTRRFTVTNPDTEGQDYDNHSVGDINAITGIGLSSKPDSNKEGNAIGKFGMGFKSIFQYTDTPEIYDPNVAFLIERQIVPKLLNYDYSGRRADETVFVFPFNKIETKRPALDSFEKLKSLLLPTLFLNNLKTITFNFGDCSGEYCKRVIEKLHFEKDGIETICERIEYIKTISTTIEKTRMLLFSRMDSDKHRYAIGFTIGEDGRPIPADYKAFCFFPTKHETNLKFLIHAPFLLTDSRETIKEFEDHNKEMVDKLSELACDAILYMRDMRTSQCVRLVDDDILNVIPIGKRCFFSNCFFNPFWQRMIQLFSTERILPTEIDYAGQKNAYWPTSKQISVVFLDDKLQALYKAPDIHWVFRSKWNDTNLASEISCFLTDCNIKSPTEISILDRVTADFIEAQPMSWLSVFYKWINDDEKRRNKARKLPIFLDAEGKACAAFDDEGCNILFRPIDDYSEYTTLCPELLKDENALALIERYGIAEPDRSDHYRWIIENKLPEADFDELDGYLKPLLEYYFTLPSCDKTTICRTIRPTTKFRAVNCKTKKVLSWNVNELYFPTETLKNFFSDCGMLFFVDEEHYVSLVGEKYRTDVHEFFDSLGVSDVPRIRTVELPRSEAYNLKVDWEYATSRFRWTEQQIDGFNEVFTRFDNESAFNNKRILSKAIWEQLYRVAKSLFGSDGDGSRYSDLQYHLRGEHRYYYYNVRSQDFDSRILTRIKETEWVYGADEKFHRPSDLNTQILSPDYKEFGDGLHSFLGIQKYIEPVVNNARNELSSADTELLKLGEFAKEHGVTEDDIIRFAQKKKKEEEAERNKKLESSRLMQTVSTVGASEMTVDVTNSQNELSSKRQTSQESIQNAGDVCKNDYSMIQGREAFDSNEQYGSFMRPVHVQEHHRAYPERKTVRARILEASDSIKNQRLNIVPPLPDPFEEEDYDEHTPRTVDFGKKLREREQREIREIALIEHGEELQKKAVDSPRYSFGWFKAMLDLEMLGNEKEIAEKREITIHFTRIEREVGTERTFVLKYPSRSLPQWLEELTGIALDLMFSKNVRAVIEVMSVQSYNLRVKLKSAAPLDGIDLKTLKEATIAAKSPDFLLASLKEGLNALPFEDGKNFKEDLTENLEFIFGPPGTGKTTYLATDCIHPLMRGEEDMKVLVLTPTNKAADVLTSRIIEKAESTTYVDWLIRFGATGDETLEKTGVCKGKDINLAAYSRQVVITTIARFPYDFFIPGNGAPQKLVDQDWDYIIIDEASMIPLVNIIYPMFRKDCAHFIVAGDPFQIEPIITNDLWREENIYTMVGLGSFSDPKTEPRNYPVKKLTTQYRSVPYIGAIFSAYCYGNILNHARKRDSLRPIQASGFPTVKPLTIIKFPVSPYESVYRAKRLGLKGGSSYQIYSALFTFEFICGLAQRMSPQGTPFRIGVISPYRAQANLVQRLIESQKLPEYIRVFASTVHGFQGDECEMIVSLFNPPPGLSSRKGSFINKKNIINVAVSRAKDYLVVMMPDDATANLGNMIEVRKIEALMRNDSEALIVHEAKNIESAILGSSTFIEDNAFSTGHQMVNVYGAPERRYEIRTDETAVDVQLHMPVFRDISASGTSVV